MIQQRRSEDKGWLYRFAALCSAAWDWIDKRDIDKHAVSLAILWGTVKITTWSMDFAETHGEKTGLEAAAIIGAVAAPYMALQAAAIAFYFRARQ